MTVGQPLRRSVERGVLLKRRTATFAVNIVQLFRELPRAHEARIIGNQLLRSGTSVGANYRSLLPARSRREFIARAGVVVEEADESLFWLELPVDLEIVSGGRVQPLRNEANEFIAILVAARSTARKRS